MPVSLLGVVLADKTASGHSAVRVEEDSASHH